MTLSKYVKLNKKFQLVIPKDIRKELEVKEGDELIIMKDDNFIILTTPEIYAKKTRGLLKGTWYNSKKEIEEYIDKERGSWE